jgi:hypothetical protein
MERGFRKNNNAMCQPDSEFVQNYTHVANLCTGPPQFVSSCIKLHPPHKFMYISFIKKQVYVYQMQLALYWMMCELAPACSPAGRVRTGGMDVRREGGRCRV